jgi:hypothetical protein
MAETEALESKKETILENLEKKKATREERRAKALVEGKQYRFIVCPLCLRARIGKSWKGKTVFNIDPNPEVIQIRYGLGGRGYGGFFKNVDECIKLSELKDADPEVYNNLKEEIGKLFKLFYE